MWFYEEFNVDLCLWQRLKLIHRKIYWYNWTNLERKRWILCRVKIVLGLVKLGETRLLWTNIRRPEILTDDMCLKLCTSLLLSLNIPVVNLAWVF